MDIKKTVEEIIIKVKNDKDFGKKFMSDPVKAVESVVGVDLPDDVINQIIAGVKAKVNIDELSGKLGGILNKLKG